MAGQLGIWHAQQLSPDNSVYNTGEYLEIHGDLDMDLFEVALQRTVSEAEAGHLRFCGDGEALRQYVDRRADWSLHVIDVSSAADPRAAAEDWMWADMRRPVDLREGPLFTQAVFRVAHSRFFWYQRAHHIAVDGLGASAIAARQAQVYTSLLTGLPPGEGALEPVSVLMDADSSYRASADFGRDREFWLNALADFPEVASISGRRVSRALHVPVRYMEDISPGDAADLRAAARRLKTSFGGLMITAAAVYLHRSTGAEEVVLGLSVLGRAGSRLRGIPGMTANVLPIRLTVGRGTSIEELVQQTSRMVRDALRHQRYRYEDIRRDLKLIDGGALFGLIINVMSFDYTIRFGDCPAIAHNLSNGPVNDLSVAVHDRSADGSIQIALNANPDLYDAASGRDITSRFRRVLDWMITVSPAAYPGQAEILAEAERRQILTGLNDTATPVPTVGGVHELIAGQAARTPDAVAVVCGGVSLTYAGLEERANRLAHYLRGAGAGPESIVGLCLPGGADM